MFILLLAWQIRQLILRATQGNFLCVLSRSVMSNSVTPMGYSPSGSSVCGILQERILEWVAIPFSRGPSWPRNWTRVSCIAGRFFTTWATKPSIFSLCETFLEGQPQGPLSIDGCFLGLGHSIHSYVWLQGYSGSAFTTPPSIFTVPGSIALEADLDSILVEY